MTDTVAASSGEGIRPRIHVPIHLRWGDLDAYNHVNNTAMLKLLEEARVRAFWKDEDGGDSPSTAVLDATVGSGLLTLIARQEIVYLQPVPYQRRPLDVQMWFGKVGGSSLEVCYDICGPAGSSPQALYARAVTVVVKVDAATGAPVRFSAEERTAFERYLDEPLVLRR